MIVPLYQAEISPPHARGLLSGWTQMMISIGFFAANWVGYGCQFLGNNAQFRVPLAIQIVPAVALGLYVLILVQNLSRSLISGSVRGHVPPLNR